MKMPVIALRGMVILPKMLMHFDVSRRKSIAAVERAMVQDERLFLAGQKDDATMDPGEEDLHHIGTIVMVKQLLKLPNQVIRVLVEGIERGELVELTQKSPFLEGEVEERVEVGAKVQKGGLFHVAPVRVDDALFFVCTSGEIVKVSMKTRRVSEVMMVEKGSCRRERGNET